MPNDKSRKEFADRFFDMKCGPLHLAWHIDAYWKKVTEDMILPAVFGIHTSLTNNNYTENNKHGFNDADDTIFYIPAGDKKVFVHTTQSRDFLYVYDENEYEKNLHIRRLWRKYSRNNFYYNVKDVIRSIQSAINNVDHLSEYSDDNAEFSFRPSLQFYKSIGFEISHDAKNKDGKGNLNNTCGDFRDGGYILSYKARKKYNSDETYPAILEGTKYSFVDLESLTTCLIPYVTEELEFEHTRLKGYQR
jgi:hypothetical protein